MTREAQRSGNRDNGNAPDQRLRVITLPESGVALKVRNVGILLLQQVQRAWQEDHPLPSPPSQEVDYGDGKKVSEPNLAHPDYVRQLQAYNLQLAERVLEVIIRRGVVLELGEEERAQLAELREEMGTLGVVLPADDKFAYVSYIAVEGDADLSALRNAVLRISQPTEEEIQSARSSFPGGV